MPTISFALRSRSALRSGQFSSRLASRFGFVALWLLALLGAATTACDNPNAIVLSIRPPAGVALAQYAVIVQERENRTIVYQSGVQPIDAVAKGRDLSAEPLKIGLKLTKTGTFLIHVRASADTLAPDGVTPTTRTPEYFFANLITANGTVETDVELLQVDPQFDKDFDHFPDGITWPAALPAAQARYQGHPELLDCIDNDPSTGDPPLPVPYFAVQINPLAKPVCGLAIDLSCEGKAPVCKDVDGDGDPENLDCDDSDPKRFHGNPRPRNCCQCTDIKSCATNHAKLADQSVCSPARCDSAVDYDCTGRVVPCFVDDDCDGFSPNDSNVSLRDCDDTNPDVHPGAARKCGDTSHDWACDGAPAAGCIACDLDGDGYQRNDAANGCPTAGYTRPVDCDDNDRGVFPGSTSFEGVTLITRDLKSQEGGGSVAAALRGLCRNQAATFQTTLQPQDADCDGSARNGCPSAACDVDGDGYPLGTAGCNPLNLPVDCDDSDPHTFPGAPEKCGDGKAQGCVADRPCAGAIDVDGDGYTSDYDCDDNDSKVHPWATEICNGADDDCDGLVDEQNPDSTGNPLISSYVVGAQTLRGITSCTDDNDGECGKKSATTGAYSGRCVCSGQAPNGQVDVPKHTACPGVAINGLRPGCFGATQPTLQTCVASQVKDEDCDGRTDAPDGVKLLEAGSACGVTTGTCVAGTVKGCDRSKTNPFYMPATGAVSPAFDSERRFLTCNTDAVTPTAEICDTKDNNCNAASDETCTEIGGATSPTCCMVSMAPVCKDLNSDFNFCGNCNTQCSAVTANQCATGKCKCGASLACSGTNPLCKAATGTCVQCFANPDCNGTPATPNCDTTSNNCVQCVNDANCMALAPATPYCFSNSCFQCKMNSDCTTAAASKCSAGHSCVGCAVASDCSLISGKNQCKVGTGCVQCLGNSDCTSAAASVCNGANSCVGCSVAADCALIAGKNQCLAGTGCVQCLSAANCTTAATPSCDAATHACRACAVDADCTGSAFGPRCNTATGQCVQCNNSAQCATATKPICTGNTCVACTTNALCDAKLTTAPKCQATGDCAKCVASSDCNFDTNRPTCHPVTGDCDKCATNLDCSTNTNGNKCNAAAGSCGKCTTNADCNYDPLKPSCDTTSGLCKPCTTAGLNCTGAIGGNACNPATGSCVGCVGNSDCVASSATPTCKSNVCSACTGDADCTGNVNGTHCDVGMGKCVQCINSAQCLMSTLPICTADTCVKCPNNASCDLKSTTAPKCNATGDCSKCTASSDCNFDANRPTCHPITGDCAKCAVNSDCATNGNGNKCNAAMGNCTKCATNADCNYDPLKPSCDAGTGLCMPCTTPGLNCAGSSSGGTVCDAAGQCVQCVGSLDCAAGTTPICISEMCAMCTTNAQCNARDVTTPKCTVGVGSCSKCTVNNDCNFDVNKPVCKPATGDCRACAANVECDGNTNGNRCAGGACAKCTANSDCNFDPLRPSCNTTSGLCEPCTNPGRTCTGAFGGGLVCDTAGKCVDCTTSAQCMNATAPICTGEMCKMCANNTECNAKDPNAPKCTAGVGNCSKCVDNSDCNFDSTKPVCDPIGGSCGKCTSDGDCAGNAMGNKCDTVSGMCGKCTANSDCNFDVTKPSCDTSDGICKPCTTMGLDCTGAVGGEFCDAGGMCVKCTMSSQCTASPTLPICTAEVCSMCTANTECESRDPKTPKCLTATGACDKCAVNADCTVSNTRPKCDTAMGDCVKCTANVDCVGNVNGTKCDTAGGSCGKCTVNSDCDFDPNNPSCDTVSGTCKPCTAAGVNCTGAAGGPTCDTGTGKCVGCIASTDCATATKPICSSMSCIACMTNTQCEMKLSTTPLCLGTGDCAPCSADTDCTVSATRPICDKSGGATNGSCKACIAGSTDCMNNPAGDLCPTGGACGCSADAECNVATSPICDTTGTMTCKKCATSAECTAKNAAFPNCDTMTGICS